MFQGRRFLALRDTSDRSKPNRRKLWTQPGEDVSGLTGFTPRPGGERYERIVHRDELDALYSDRMYFVWKGQTFLVTGFGDDGRVSGYWQGGDIAWAREHGLRGNQYDGHFGTFPVDEVEEFYVERKDLLTGRTERRDA
ncbi:hypothetical protein CFN78_23385 [Amycolatopsis antarctica]|uniref:Uncharacterized protein n=1 Tax=Amycolatopsis antarctica TaxID=1854586 RepID=A0A263D0G8_9PSEU|nr:hypothetical protein CFN78_23385 [Amycolatopsis antarctica]